MDWAKDSLIFNYAMIKKIIEFSFKYIKMIHLNQLYILASVMLKLFFLNYFSIIIDKKNYSC